MVLGNSYYADALLARHVANLDDLASEIEDCLAEAATDDTIDVDIDELLCRVYRASWPCQLYVPSQTNVRSFADAVNATVQFT